MALLHVKQLYKGTITSTGAGVVMYVVPAGFRVVVRSIVFRNNASVSNVVRVSVLGTVQVFTTTLGAVGTTTASYEWRPWLVLEPDDDIRMNVGNSGGVGVVVSGSLYFI